MTNVSRETPGSAEASQWYGLHVEIIDSSRAIAFQNQMTDSMTDPIGPSRELFAGIKSRSRRFVVRKHLARLNMRTTMRQTRWTMTCW
jgi:hypothetical protein